MQFVDGEAAFRDWVNAHPTLTGDGAPLTAGAWLEQIRSAAEATYTVITRAGGGRDLNVPLDQPRLQFAVWGPTRDRASTAALALAGALAALDGTNTLLNASVRCRAVTVTGPRWLPDNGVARYLIDAVTTLHPA